ncbi:putative RING-type E3 ubiquitin transferase C3H69 isoform X2 [Abrus precatorius]|uniref:RING-type E3 ubiquitin transferase C3H69 isoform X2 n=1 Tax=Abrus precatorius TaxID=3816 RepID=A0A8B8KAV7_ABRPR|nr:putative RING-type E3 ubiquitin transferase C3H69 isoform X2 [Abrus precatorius]XP_027340274.1 putative RING-type E3 ubiquitin transferase C3H69 isoform X2 [Abrus precatorius]XP_027340275.1 putative RING-type E3 ubiquitin transferase C3H69 isoform X2 [Abrus precatorius]
MQLEDYSIFFNFLSSESSRVLCKFFAHGACLKGEHCEFSHDWKDPPNNICTFYQKGVCAYGSRCRYDHVKAPRAQSSTPSSSVIEHQPLASDSAAFGNSRTTSNGFVTAADFSLSGSPYLLPHKPAWNQESEYHEFLGEEDVGQSIITSPSEHSICSFAAAGNCPRGEKCPHIHGDLCPTCGKHCLHPFRSEEREEHMKSCENKQKHLDALKRSQEIECSVCLERVLSKPTAAERKFGLLSECDHPFCISCIRNWRSSNPTLGMDVNSTLRACPICRKLSYFVIPSVIWYSTTEEKLEIIDNYKAKLKSIDCKHFDFGDGNCPFGTSCFYKHAYRDGRLEQVVLRHLGAADGNTVIAKDIRLSDFLANMHLR